MGSTMSKTGMSTGGFAMESKETVDRATGDDEKGAIDGHNVKTEMTSNQAQGDTGTSISELIMHQSK